MATKMHPSVPGGANSQHHPGEGYHMKALMPLSVGSFKQEIDRLFDRLIEPGWFDMPASFAWAPKMDVKMDVKETKDAYVVAAELPGMDQKDINVALTEETLTVSGDKREDKEEKDGRSLRLERSYGAFERSIRLPSAVDGSRVTATFKDGVVTITLPKAPGAKTNTIPVKAA